ncbi:conjugal transfer protein TraI [Sphingomonas sp. Root710]|uniref:relaxase/mobilization nuclease RlxS n=1 Tax=Sphingomonas sp. Root710 TaxID=1736594 RepID=UPI0006FBF930|nr:relaxase/mobilization nuclease RlxS [Sphingomonas sp. Root710]KRB83128.1 conjugal transfer protein TraI [Sphingomonas sp. Root710]
MDDNDGFTPKLGRAKGKDGNETLRFTSRIAVAARLAGAKTGVASRRFDGSRIGRGASIGRLLSSRDRFAGLRSRRAIVKTRLVRLGARGLSGARAHLRYIQRDGVTREGAPGELYGPEAGQADGKAFLERCDGDRHQFRFIVSAEDGAEYADLKPYVRRLMTQAEHDLGTKLDWVAVDHFNTDQPHTHIMLRGVDDRGQNLIIAREYIAHGLRQRAAELATIDLGPRTDREIERRLRHDVEQERLTAIDRRLIRRMDDERKVTAASNDPFQQSVAAGRLRKLGAMGLAEDLGSGRWRLADGIEDTLRHMGERGDIIRTMQRELTARKLDRAGVDRRIHDQLDQPIVGRIVHRGLSDEHHDRHYLIVDGIDGRVHYLDIGRGDLTEPMPEESIVRIAPRSAAVREVDRTVAAVAQGNGGRYSIDAHLRHDAGATQGFAEAHVRRLEAMRRAGMTVERMADGSWTIGADHLDQAAAYEARGLRDRPVEIETFSALPIARLKTIDAATWLDREIGAATPMPVRDAGFGREVRSALDARRQWLIEQELADIDGGKVRLRANAVLLLQRRELRGAGERLAAELGKPFVEARIGSAIEGRLARRVDLAGGRFALVEKSMEFTLVPWRPMLERQMGAKVAGLMRSDGINWRLGRYRDGPAIS